MRTVDYSKIANAEKDLPIDSIFSSTLYFTGVGGQKKKCDTIPISKNSERILALVCGDMERQEYDVKPKRVYNPPFTLDPSLTTFEDIRNHALTRQNLSPSTVNSYLRLAGLMETDPCIPVNFKDPSWEQFFRHMDYIKMHGATPHALKNRRKAWHMFLRAWGLYKEFPNYALPQAPDRSYEILIPTPETVYDLLHYHYVGDKYLNRCIQYHFFTGFMVGMRPEKEMLILDVDDITLDDYDNYTIRITEPKKHSSVRTLRLEENIAVSGTRKSFKNYIDTIRPRFANRGELALLVDPSTGNRWTEDSLRHTLLNYYGKQVWSRFYPYIMRHWALTARCIEWQNDNRVLARLQHWAGHRKLEQTLRYLSLASLYNQGKGSWLSRALKRSKRIGGLHVIPGKERISTNNAIFVPSPPGKEANPDRSAFILSCWKERIKSFFSLFVQAGYNSLSHLFFFSFFQSLKLAGGML